MDKSQFFLFIAILLTFSNCSSTKISTVDAAKQIPYFTFYTLDSQRFIKDSLDTERNKLFLYFNSECDHCQKQARWLSKKIDLFSHLEIIFISFEEMDAIKNFRDIHQFYQKNITFLQDSRLTFSDKFGVGKFPSILLYTKKGKLIYKFEGETKVEEVLEFL